MLFILLFGRFSELAVFRAATERTTRKTADTHKHNQSTLDVVYWPNFRRSTFRLFFMTPMTFLARAREPALPFWDTGKKTLPRRPQKAAAYTMTNAAFVEELEQTEQTHNRRRKSIFLRFISSRSRLRSTIIFFTLPHHQQTTRPNQQQKTRKKTPVIFWNSRNRDV